MELKAKAEHAAGLMSELAKLVGAGVLAVTILGAAFAVGGEIFARRIIIDAIELEKGIAGGEMVPKDLNLRIVEKIEFIRANVRTEQLLEQKAVTRVDDISFKAEGIDFSVVKLLAPVKAALGFGDAHVTGVLTCYRFGCGLEPEDEDRFGEAGPGAPAKDTLRLRLALIIQGANGTRGFTTRMSVNTENFRKDLDGDMLAAAEAVMEQTDPVTVASFYYLASKEISTLYMREKNRGLAVAATQRAYRLGRADLCWAASLLATIAIDQDDLIGADARIASVPQAARALNPTCDAQLSLAKGLVNRGMLHWRGAQHLTPGEAAGFLREARGNFLLAAGLPGAAPETRSDALIEAARASVDISGDNLGPAVELLSGASDCKSGSYLVGGRCDLAAKLLREAARLERRAGRLDAALTHNWRAIQADPGNARPYIELGGILLDRAMAPGKDDRPVRDLREANALLHQALNGSPDAEKVAILTEIAEVDLALGEAREAVRNLSNIRYALERSLFQARSVSAARRAFSLWLFILRKDPARLCLAANGGLKDMQRDAATLFETASKAARCDGDVAEAWPLVALYEAQCGEKNGLALAGCLREQGKR